MGATHNAEDPPQLRREIDRVVLARLRRRAAHKIQLANYILTLTSGAGGVSHEEARYRIGREQDHELTVEDYHRARRWLNAARREAVASGGVLTIDEALRAYAERHVQGVIHVGLLKERGLTESKIRERMGITGDQFAIAWGWWQNATTGLHRNDE